MAIPSEKDVSLKDKQIASSCKSPYYSFEEFKRACGIMSSKVVSFSPDAVDDADEYFQLRGTQAILDFIVDDGLERLTIDETKLWEKNPHPEHPIYIDSYFFATGCKVGYIAFMYDDCKCQWRIKSFHPPKYLPPDFQSVELMSIGKQLLGKMGDY